MFGVRVARLFTSGLLAFVTACAPTAHAQENDASADKNSEANADDKPKLPATPKRVFLSLLREYKRYPKDYFSKMQMEDTGLDQHKIEAIDYAAIEQLAPAVLQARYTQFNVTYSTYKRIETKLLNERKVLEKRRRNTPTTGPEARELELKLAAQQSHYEQARYLVFHTSVEANKSLLEALSTLGPNAKAAVAKGDAKPSERPKLPGTYQGSEADRRRLKEADKINLTPVDPEFYQTQLGRKLETDLGGRADFWSYDYTTDDMYVKVADEVAKVSVFQDAGGMRFIRTRVGSAFAEPKVDLRIDSVAAKGRFLTGDKREETLFGKMPPSQNNGTTTGGGTAHPKATTPPPSDH